MGSLPQGLPIIDLAPAVNGSSDFSELVDPVANACKATGCFYIKNHGIDYSLINDLFRDSRTFFDQPLEYKMKYKLDYSLDRGYFPFETQNVNAFMGRLGLPNDPVEKLAFGPSRREYPVPENVWPDIPAPLKETVEKYYESFEKLANTMMRVFALAAKAPDEDYFYRNCCDGAHSLKVNLYPSHSKPKLRQETRFAAHTDITPFTILAADNCPKALQVKNAHGEWIYADPIPRALFVNLGDIMQRWTNDEWKATEHKVVWPEGDQVPDRQSIVYFIAMNPGAVIGSVPSCVPAGEAAKYEPRSYKEYLASAMRGLSPKY